MFGCGHGIIVGVVAVVAVVVGVAVVGVEDIAVIVEHENDMDDDEVVGDVDVSWMESHTMSHYLHTHHHWTS